MQQDKLGGLRERILAVQWLKGSILALAIFILGFTIIPCLIAEASAASDISAGVRWGSVFLVLDPDKAATDAGTSAVGDAGHGDIDFDELIPSQRSGANYGTLKVTKKTINITSSGQYYTVYLSTNSSNNNLNLNIGEDSIDTSVRIPALTSTFASPAVFSSTGWGFAVPCDTTVQAGVTCMSEANWVTPSLLDTQMTSATTLTGASATYNNTLWAGVPNSDNAVQIWKAEAQGSAGTNYGFGSYEKDGATVTGDTTNNHFDIYYAVAVDTDTLAGTYSNEIVYTALASASSLDTVSTNMQVDQNFGAAKDVMTLKFDLNESTVSIDEADILIKIVPHQTIISEEYEIANLDASDYYTCPVVQNSLDDSSDAYMQVQCKLPKGLNVEDGSGNGEYDFWMYIDGYGYNYISRDVFEGTQVATFYSVGLQSTYPTNEGAYANGDSKNPSDITATSRAGSLIVTKMQEMSSGICNNTNAWGNTTSLDTRTVKTTDPDPEQEGEEGEVTETEYFTNMAKVNVYDYTGGGNVVANGAAATALGAGTFQLEDIRDNHPYLVRRLADGNCWMVENLDLELSTVGTLTPEDSDVSEEWDPYGKVDKNDFSTWSLNNLGQDQPAQYQAKGQIGYFWGSKYYNDNGVKTLGDEVINNEYAEIARSYDNSSDWIDSSHPEQDGSGTLYRDADTPSSSSWYLGNYYNWYAATAESGTYAMTSGDATDSICPLGWQLPVNVNNKSWNNLINSVYGIDSSVSGSRSLRSFPLSIILSGYNVWTTGNYDYKGRYGFYWAATASATTHANNLMLGSREVSSQAAFNNNFGMSIRCVAHGEELTEDAVVVASQDTDTVSTCVANKICYNKNGGTGTMSDQSASASSSATLTAPSFIKLGYAFAGWSTTENGFGGELYGPNEAITTPSTLGSAGLQLYAKWLPASTQYTMQTFTAQACSDLGMHQTIALRDERDNNVYTVAKLKDDNCWMTSNLALNLADFAGTHNLTPANTDLNSTEAVTRGYWDPSESTVTKYTTTYASELDTRNLSHDFAGLSELLLGQAQPAQFQSAEQTGYWWGSKVSDDGNWTALDSVTNNANAEIPREYHRGNDALGGYYNWYAATAESLMAAAGNVTLSAEDSICPAGWQLPKSGNSATDKSFSGLFFGAYHLNNASSNEQAKPIFTLPFLTPKNGLYDGNSGTINYRGNSALFYSSTMSFPSKTAYILDAVYTIFPTYVVGYLHPSVSGGYLAGYGVRCVRK